MMHSIILLLSWVAIVLRMQGFAESIIDGEKSKCQPL